MKSYVTVTRIHSYAFRSYKGCTGLMNFFFIYKCCIGVMKSFFIVPRIHSYAFYSYKSCTGLMKSFVGATNVV